MNKKGFTLVELAMVLVVIGLIIGMASKGRVLLEQAEARRLVINVQKVSTAFYIYYSKYRLYPGGYTNLPPYQQGTKSIVARKDMVDLGIIAANDFRVGFGVDSLEFIQIGDVAINMGQGVTGVGFDWNINNPTNRNYAGIEFVKKDTRNPRGYSGTSSDKLICYVETMLDDMDIAGGLGRVAFEAQPGQTYSILWAYPDYDPVAQFSNCFKQSVNKKRSIDGYNFKIF